MASSVLVRGQLYALAAMAIWSTNFMIGRVLRDAVTPETIAAFRALVAGVPLCVAAALAGTVVQVLASALIISGIVVVYTSMPAIAPARGPSGGRRRVPRLAARRHPVTEVLQSANESRILGGNSETHPTTHYTIPWATRPI